MLGDLKAQAVKSKAVIALVIGGLAIGCSPILVRVSELGAVTTAFWRIALALLPLYFINLKQSSSASSGTAVTWRDRALAALPGVFLGAELATWHISLHMTSVANATLLINMTPLSVALLGWMLFRTPLTRIFLYGMSLSIIGVIVLKGGGVLSGSGRLAGDVVAILGSFIYAGYFLSLSKIRIRFTATTVMWWSTMSAAFTVLPFALILEPAFLPASLTAIAILLALAWVCHVGGQGMITYALAWLPPTFSALTLLIQPIFAAVLAWLFLGEPLSHLQIVGGTIVLAGILLARKG